MSQTLTIIIVDKNCSLKTLTVKDYKVEDLYKKCGFKKAEDFALQVEWPLKLDGQKYTIAMYGKLNGKANMENKYDFPPPVDNKLFFGSCALVGMIRDDSNNKSLFNLSIDLWNKIYEKLFGGFEDLKMTCVEDEEEEDELENVPKNLKTKKGGYLKDGFVVDSSDTEEIIDSETEYEEDEISDETSEINDDLLEDIGSELSEEEYDL
jgi:hypothetical protein|uniref:Uncharacterized protein n=1 Tax=viral metagenome TaxID=1070528 RepID=A0A6C0KRQ4_9ZZZZ